MDCPECGAPAQSCETRYHECLVKEFSEPGYGAVHHLTVATYMLQHSSKLTKEGWLYRARIIERICGRREGSGIGQETKPLQVG